MKVPHTVLEFRIHQAISSFIWSMLQYIYRSVILYILYNWCHSSGTQHYMHYLTFLSYMSMCFPWHKFFAYFLFLKYCYSSRNPQPLGISSHGLMCHTFVTNIVPVGSASIIFRVIIYKFCSYLIILPLPHPFVTCLSLHAARHFRNSAFVML